MPLLKFLRRTIAILIWLDYPLTLFCRRIRFWRDDDRREQRFGIGGLLDQLFLIRSVARNRSRRTLDDDHLAAGIGGKVRFVQIGVGFTRLVIVRFVRRNSRDRRRSGRDLKFGLCEIAIGADNVFA